MRFIWLGLVLAGATLQIGFAQSKPDATTPFVGSWRGEAKCAVKDPACRDESVVYRIAKLPGKANLLSVTGSKLVNGSPVNMGTLQFKYVEAEHALVCEYSQGVWRLNVAGAKIDGTLTQANGKIFRRLTLRKE